MAKEENLKKGQKVAGRAVWVESILVVAKVVAGLLSGSLVLISDAVHSGSDILSIATSWVGLKIAQRKPDQRFPYGYYKAENLGTLVISVLVLYAFWEMLTGGYARLFSFSDISVPLLALGVSLVDAVFLFFFGNYEIKVGKEIGAQSLQAMGEENRTHILSSTAVLFGTLAAYYRIPYIEGIITIAISLLIFKIGFSAAKDSILALMDVSPSEEVEDKIVAAIESVPGIEEFFDLRLRKSGPFVFGEATVGIRRSVDVKRAREIADAIERKITKKVPQVDSFTIRVQPFKSDFFHLVAPVSKKDGLKAQIAEQLARAPYFIFVNLKGDEVKGHYFIKNPYEGKKVRTGLAVSKLIAKQKSDTLLTKEIGEISLHALRDNLVEVYQVKSNTVEKAITRFNEGKLKPLDKATKEKV
jgi:cation diffusion facilitator family transporter